MKLGLVTDLHYSDHADESIEVDGVSEYRRYSTADARFSEAIATFNTAAVDGVAVLGDMGNTTTTPAAALGLLEQCVETSEEARVALPGGGYFQKPVYWLPGNHDGNLVTLGGYTWAEYFAALDENWGAKSNEWPSGDEPRAYTFDYGATIRNITIPYGYEANASLLLWLEGVLNTTLACVLLTHRHLHSLPAGTPSSRYIDATDLRAKVEASGRVQAVFQGHHHTDDYIKVINDIPYFSLAGSVQAPQAADNAYYIVEITPDAYMGNSQRRAHIDITGYGLGHDRKMAQAVMVGA